LFILAAAPALPNSPIYGHIFLTVEILAMKIVSYETRVAKMHKPGDEDQQLRLAKNYVKALRLRFKKASRLDEKLEIGQAVKQAESVLRKLRLNIFD
jgi:hypothetical protein